MFFIVNCIIILITLLLVFLCLDAANLCERDLQEARVVIGFSVSFILYLFIFQLFIFFFYYFQGRRSRSCQRPLDLLGTPSQVSMMKYISILKDYTG